MSKLLRLWFAVALAVSASACSADAEQGAGSGFAYWKVGEACEVGAVGTTPASTCSGADWACAPEGQCLPTAFCLSDKDCGCDGGDACSAVCAGAHCYRTCRGNGDCAGTSRCVDRSTGTGKPLMVCY